MPLIDRSKLMSVIPFIAATSFAAAMASAFTETTVHTWYLTLQKPSWTLDPRFFGPIWTILYALMAIAAWKVWSKSGKLERRGPLLLFGIQLILNALWPACFFMLKSPLLGALEISLLWMVVVAQQGVFWRRDQLAGLLVLPYMLWGVYAGALTWTVWSLNR